MSKNTDRLSQVLSEIIANRAGLAAQIDKQRASIEGGMEQIAKFDALIATLQVATGDSAVQDLIDSQAGANAVLTGDASSPTDPAPEVDAPDAGLESAQADLFAEDPSV
jgi:hypothetical protein